LREYGTYLATTPEETERYRRFADKVRDFNALVVDLLADALDRLAIRPEYEGRTVTWHDPCHLARYQDVRSEPRTILQHLGGIEFVEMAEADRCCGLGGSFSITHYETSKSIADHKVDAIAASGADTVATACPGCMIQLRDAVTRRSLAVDVVHIGQLFTVAR
jgi:glycolate oxidase iron-sulfur subunit